MMILFTTCEITSAGKGLAAGSLTGLDIPVARLRFSNSGRALVEDKRLILDENLLMER